MIADATFQHQIVFDPVKRELVSLHDPKAAGTNEEYCKDAGSFFDNKIAFQMALGNIDPFTREKCDNWTPDEVALPRTSVWSYHYRKQTPSKKKKVEEKLNVNEIKNPNDEIKKVQTAEQLDYDTNLEAELKVYGTLRSETKKRKIIDEANAVEMFKKQEELNEVEQADSKNLGSKDETIDTVKEKEIKMPFRKSRKLSKFEPTIINYEEQTITSRFFAGKKVAQSPPPNRGADCDSLLSSIGDYAKKQTSLKLDETDAHKQDNNNVITYRINSDGKYTDINSLFISLHTPILFDNYKYAYNSFAPKISETPLNCVEEKCFSEATDDERNCNSDDIIEESPVEMKDDKSSNSKKLSEFTATKKKRLINFEKNDKSTTKLYSSESIESKQIENDKNIINVVEETSDVVIKTGEEVSINSDECVIMEKITRNESQDVSKNDDLPSSNVETVVF